MTFCQHLICMLPKKWIISSFQNNKLALKCLTAPLTRQMMFLCLWCDDENSYTSSPVHLLTCSEPHFQFYPIKSPHRSLINPICLPQSLKSNCWIIHHKQINFQKSQILNQFDTCVMLAEVFLNMHFSWMRCVHRRKDHWSWTKQCDQFFWIWDAHMWTLPWLPVSHLTSLQQSVKQQPRKTSNTF